MSFVSLPQTDRLHLFQEPEAAAPTAEADPTAWLAHICQDFELATGWPLRYVASQEARLLPDPLWSAPVAPGVGASPGYLTIGAGQPAAGDRRRTTVDAARQLAISIADLVSRLSRSSEALRRSEAELATGVPVVSRAEDADHLAERLEAVLRGGAEAIGCRAAGLYLLDAATTELKLRSCWGLPVARLTEPARPLSGAVADLEALSGSAVVLEEDMVMGAWNVPEPCGAAVCVPISTSTTILGTLWMFADLPRPFDEKQTNLVEIIAGRLAADLEREALLAEGVGSAGLRRDVDDGARLQQNQLPAAAPMVEGWDVAGRTHHGDDLAGNLGGEFHDWCELRDGRLAVTLGGANERGTAAALTAQTLRTALRAHATHDSDPAALLALANETMWSTSAGDQFAAALVATLEPRSGNLTWSSAGQVGAIVVGPDRCESLAQPGVSLGVQPDSEYQRHSTVLAAGESVVLYLDAGDYVADEFVDATDSEFVERLRDAVLQNAEEGEGVSAESLVESVRDILESEALDRTGGESPSGRAVVVVRRIES